MPVEAIDWLGLWLTNHTLRITQEKRAQLLQTWCDFAIDKKLSTYLKLCGRATFLSRVFTGLKSAIRKMGSCVPQKSIEEKDTTYCDDRHVRQDWLRIVRTIVLNDPVLSIQRNPLSVEIFVDAGGLTQRLGFANRNATKFLTINPFIQANFKAWVKVAEHDLLENGVRVKSVQISILELYAIFMAVDNC